MNKREQTSAPVNNARVFLAWCIIYLLAKGQFYDAAILSIVFVILEAAK